MPTLFVSNSSNRIFFFFFFFFFLVFYDTVGKIKTHPVLLDSISRNHFELKQLQKSSHQQKAPNFESKETHRLNHDRPDKLRQVKFRMF